MGRGKIIISKSIANELGLVLNKRWETDSGFAPKDWADVVNKMMPMPVREIDDVQTATFSDGVDGVPYERIKCQIAPSLTPVRTILINGSTSTNTLSGTEVYVPDGVADTVIPELWFNFVPAGGNGTPSNPNPILSPVYFKVIQQYDWNDDTNEFESETEYVTQYQNIVYGGKLEYNTIRGVNDYAYETLDGTETMTENGTMSYGGIQVQLTPRQTKKPASSNNTRNEGILCTMMESITFPSTELQVTGRATNGYLYFNMPADVTTIEQAKAWFAANKPKISYILDEPINMPSELHSPVIRLKPGLNKFTAIALDGDYEPMQLIPVSLDVTYYDVYEYDKSIELNGDFFGGEYEVTTGKLTVTWSHIFSYNGEELPGVWISSEEEYEPGTSPSIGATVSYERDPDDYTYYDYDPMVIKTVEGENSINQSAGNISVSYRTISVAPPPAVKYRYIKWVITNVRSGTSNQYIQMSEIEFVDADDTKFPLPMGVSITANINPTNANQAISYIVDGLTSTKFCGYFNQRPSEGVVITIDLSSMDAYWIDPTVFNKFRWYTANDSNDRDPVSWQLYLGNGTTDILVAERTNYTPTTNRQALADTVELTI